ncbi:MAG: TolC family protein [Flammeovirgaceae bacterium]
MKRWSLCLLIIGILAGNTLLAQTKVWSYSDCIAYALEHNIQMREAKYTQRTAELALFQAKKAFVPTITMGTSVNIGIGRTIDPFTNEFTNEPVFSNSWNANVSMPIFQGFRLHANLEKAKNSLENNQLNQEKTVRDLKIQIANSFLQVLFNHEQLKNAKRQLKLSQAQLQRTQKLIKAGRLPQNNSYELMVQIASGEAQIISAESSLLLSKLQLKQLLALPVEETFEINYPPIEEPDSTFLVSSIESIYQLANGMQENRINQIAIRQAEIDFKQAKRAYLPSFSISYGIGTGYSSQTVNFLPGQGEPQRFVSPIGFVSNDGGITQGDLVYQESFSIPDPVIQKMPLRDQFSQNFNQSTNIGVNIPFLSSASSLKQGLRSTRIALERARMTADNAKNQMKQSLLQQFTQAQAAYQTYKINRKKLEVQEIAFQAAESRYQKGLLNTLDYVTAKNNLLSSQNELLRSKYDAVLKIKLLYFYMGEELHF